MCCEKLRSKISIVFEDHSPKSCVGVATACKVSYISPRSPLGSQAFACVDNLMENTSWTLTVKPLLPTPVVSPGLLKTSLIDHLKTLPNPQGFPEKSQSWSGRTGRMRNTWRSTVERLPTGLHNLIPIMSRWNRLMEASQFAVFNTLGLP